MSNLLIMLPAGHAVEHRGVGRHSSRCHCFQRAVDYVKAAPRLLALYCPPLRRKPVGTDRFIKISAGYPIASCGEESGPVRDLGQGGSPSRNAPQLAMGYFTVCSPLLVAQATSLRPKGGAPDNRDEKAIPLDPGNSHPTPDESGEHPLFAIAQ